MTDYDWNDPATRTRRYKGYIQFSNPATPANFYRLKERQSLTVTFTFNLTSHYDDAGMKFLDPNGHNHTFSTTIKLTADMIDDASSDWDSSATSPKTAEGTSISYWIERLHRYEPVLMTFVTTSEALIGPNHSTIGGDNESEKMIKMKFKGQPSGFTIDMGTDTTQSVQIQGTITDIVHIKRTS